MEDGSFPLQTVGWTKMPLGTVGLLKTLDEGY